jgi:hypothetical protein
MVLAIFVAVGLAGCTSNEPYNTLPTDLPSEGESPAAARTGKAVWNESAASGEFHPTPLPD